MPLGPSFVEPALGPLALGFTLWALLSALGLAASWALAAALLPSRGLLQRAQATLLLGCSLALTAIQGLGALGLLTRTALSLSALSLFGAALALALHLRRDLGAQLRDDLRAPGRLVRAALTEREPLALALLACALPYAAQLLCAWAFRSWTWDPVWYHVPITNAAIQGHDLGYLGSHNVRAEGFTRNLELLSVWNVLLPRDSQLDDVAQLPFAALAFVSLAAWARGLGTRPALAAGLGACFLVVPPLFVQVSSTHVDVACAALLLTTWQQWSGERFGRAERLLGLAALALYAGTKFTGLFHAGLLAPLFLARLGFELHRRRATLRGLLAELALCAPLAFWLGGGLIYVHNWRAHENPLWPIATRVLGLSLPGTVDSTQEWVPPFFAAPGSFARMWRSWYALPAGTFWPDVRGGGFGPLYRWLGLPCAVLVAANLLRRRELRRGLSVLGLLGLALVVPDAWWPRFTLCAAAAALGAVALVLHELQRLQGPRGALARTGVSLAALVLACAGIVEGWSGLHALPLLGQALRTPHAARAFLQPIDWVWPPELCRLREQEVHEGEAIAFDDSVFFLTELWNLDVRNRVIFVQHRADGDSKSAPPGPAEDARYLEGLRRAGAVWAAVKPGQNAERLLLGLGAQRLYLTRRYEAAILRLPGSFRAGGTGPRP